MKKFIVELVGRHRTLILKNGESVNLEPFKRVEIKDRDITDSILNGIEMGVIGLVQYEEQRAKETPILPLAEESVEKSLAPKKRKKEGGI